MPLSEVEMEAAETVICDALAEYLASPRGTALITRVAAEMGILS